MPWIRIVIGLILFISITWLYFNIKYYRGKEILTAGREIAFCYKELTLKDNNTFVENMNCFMNDRIRGTYKIMNDTIYFEDYITDQTNYKYGLIENSVNGTVSMEQY